jgi:delta8-fatty-acid desaturase
VYDVTSWADHHPGGYLPLVNMAGMDATDNFLAYHPASVYTAKLPCV